MGEEMSEINNYHFSENFSEPTSAKIVGFHGIWSLRNSWAWGLTETETESSTILLQINHVKDLFNCPFSNWSY